MVAAGLACGRAGLGSELRWKGPLEARCFTGPRAPQTAGRESERGRAQSSRCRFPAWPGRQFQALIPRGCCPPGQDVRVLRAGRGPQTRKLSPAGPDLSPMSDPRLSKPITPSSGLTLAGTRTAGSAKAITTGLYQAAPFWGGGAPLSLNEFGSPSVCSFLIPTQA